MLAQDSFTVSFSRAGDSYCIAEPGLLPLRLSEAKPRIGFSAPGLRGTLIVSRPRIFQEGEREYPLQGETLFLHVDTSAVRAMGIPTIVEYAFLCEETGTFALGGSSPRIIFYE